MFYRQRQVVRPGVTGWAQMKYRHIPEDTLRRLEFDLYYIKHMSQIFDNYIIFSSIRELLRLRWLRLS